ncbi:MAG TPA: methyltransferase domain-containing protein [Gaiellaceae bacterium]|nr:methyltransferase domain-containing protein [Gaiellaceae bacterium]
MDDAVQRAEQTYDAAADTYDAPVNGFWNVHGSRTVERLGLAPTAHVLDLPCGSGSSALAAARVAESVLAVDIAANLLDLARAKAEREGLTNIEFLRADMRATGLANEAFDAVVSVHGVFFVPDRVSLMRELWRLVAPGGVLAVTTWGPDMLEPGAGAFWDAVGAERPDLVRGFNPWDDFTSTAQLIDLYTAAGIPNARAELEEYEQPLASPEDWWSVVLGTGFRGTVEQLHEDAVRRVRIANVAALADVRRLNASVVYGAAVKIGDV